MLTGWGNPVAILCGLMAMLLLSGALAIRDRTDDAYGLQRVLTALLAGGFIAAALFAFLIIAQLMWATIAALDLPP